MSRVGKTPVAVPDGVEVTIENRTVKIKGPKCKEGPMEFTFQPSISVEHDGDAKQIVVKRAGDEGKVKALHGLTRAIIQNMIVGVTKGYEKKLEIHGVGYLAAIAGDVLQLRVGFANEIHRKIPQGLDVKCPDQTHIVISGIDKQQVGQFAAEVRAVRKPEPYKGKGIRYEGEQIRRKAGKAGAKK